MSMSPTNPMNVQSSKRLCILCIMIMYNIFNLFLRKIRHFAMCTFLPLYISFHSAYLIYAVNHVDKLIHVHHTYTGVVMHK